MHCRYSLVFSLAMVLLSGCDHSPSTPPSGNAAAGQSTAASRQLTEEQARQLAEIIVQYPHPQRSAWAILSSEIRSNPPGLNDEVIALLKKRYTVYFDQKALPAGAMVRGAHGELQQYENGFAFSFVAEFEEENCVKIQFSEWWSSLGASLQWRRYMWMSGKKSWEFVDSGPKIVS